MPLRAPERGDRRRGRPIGPRETIFQERSWPRRSLPPIPHLASRPKALAPIRLDRGRRGVARARLSSQRRLHAGPILPPLRRGAWGAHRFVRRLVEAGVPPSTRFPALRTTARVCHVFRTSSVPGPRRRAHSSSAARHRGRRLPEAPLPRFRDGASRSPLARHRAGEGGPLRGARDQACYPPAARLRRSCGVLTALLPPESACGRGCSPGGLRLHRSRCPNHSPAHPLEGTASPSVAQLRGSGIAVHVAVAVRSWPALERYEAALARWRGDPVAKPLDAAERQLLERSWPRWRPATGKPSTVGAVSWRRRGLSAPCGGGRLAARAGRAVRLTASRRTWRSGSVPTPTVPSPGSRRVLRGHGRGRVGMQNTQPPRFQKNAGKFSRLPVAHLSPLLWFPGFDRTPPCRKTVWGRGREATPPQRHCLRHEGVVRFALCFAAPPGPRGGRSLRNYPCGKAARRAAVDHNQRAAAESDEPPGRSEDDPRMLAVSESGGGAWA